MPPQDGKHWTSDIVQTYPMVDLFLILVDRDGEEIELWRRLLPVRKAEHLPQSFKQ
ncbi:hypothetical protein D187_009413 [Cystobacter fuscus DSM 2262]|uniref:Uncharacterized protein n=1 Tax=Cystobacter fuscus (strain ATCC 25194 / DSM 2262 / NBRC 100088 / M29) TaxID=1242864 RepID=S9NWD5_CYSF2|nr:hypothetical protein [Cystobacter fuscus]EPX55206.1 hypothetical protein D187_009413 [Cystobacter fuscus DSM 2262]